jgi:multiple sugar transport system substrate-binding protein
MDQERADQGQKTTPVSQDGRDGLTRAQLLKTAGAAGAAAVLGGGVAQAAAKTVARTAASLKALPKGYVGGPTGFAGANRYWYAANTAAGRASLALRKLTNNGKSPITLNMSMWTGATGQLTVPFPTGAPAVAELLLKETGVKLHLTAIDPTAQVS